MKHALLLCAILLLTASVSPAIQFINAPRYELLPDETATEELWLIAESNITFRGLAEEDVFAVTAVAELSGTFANDLWAMADQVGFTGRARDDVRLLGRTLRIAGTTDRNLVAAGTTVEVDTGATIGQDAVLIGEDVLFKGGARNLRIMASRASVSGRVKGNLRVAAADIVVLPGTEIEGDLVYTSPDELVLDSRVLVRGNLRRSLTFPGGYVRPQPSSRSRVSFQSFLYINALLALLVFCAVFPHFTGRAVRMLRQSPGWCLLAGLLAFGLLPMVGFVSMLTLVGLATGAFTIGIYLAMLYLAKGIVALVLGGMIMRRRGPQPFRNVFSALSFGLLILYASVWIPYIGDTIMALVAVLGLGALVLSLFSREAPGLVVAAQPVVTSPLPRTSVPLNPEDINESEP